LEEALSQKKELERKRKLRRFLLVPFKPVLVKSWDQKRWKTKGGEYKYLGGFELEESESGLGHFLTFLLKKSPKDGRVLPITPEPSMSISDFFQIPYIISSLKSGDLTLPVYEDGSNVLMSNPIHNGGKRVPKVEIEAIRKEIIRLKKRIEQLEAEKFRLEKQREENELEIARLRNELAIAQHRADLACARAQSETFKVRAMLDDYAKFLHDGISAEVNRRLTQDILIGILEDRERFRKFFMPFLRPAIREALEEEIWKKVESRFSKMLEQAKEFGVPTKPIKKEEEKK